jgi:tRNA dimethylallyltransferase
MNIGTAKPNLATRLKHPHHLVDILDPTQSYSAAQFREDALSRIEDIVERGRIPLLVGGTMLYFKALTEGLSELPQADAATRLVIDAMAADAGWAALHAELQRIDPATAGRLDPNDAQRIQRALEVYYVTGKTMSSLLERPKEELPFEVLRIALVPSERIVLHERIAVRFEEMLEMGLIAEVRQLRADYELKPELPSMRCVGYRQTWRYLDGVYGLSTLREKGIAATRQLAKRQLTWLRAMPEMKTFDSLDEDVSNRVADWIGDRLQSESR